MDDESRVVDHVTRFYLESGDFNGVPAWQLAEDISVSADRARCLIASLIREGKLSAVFGDRQPNPHIRAFEDKSIEVQIKKLEQASFEDFCLYPTPTVLAAHVNPATYQGRPFTLKLALGEPQLAHYAFDLSVLEFYRNDPRYYYHNNDISGSIMVSDSLHCAGTMHQRDQVLLQTFGFAYDDDLNRAVAVFLRYLAGLTPEHQQIWHAKVLGTWPQYKLHPDYYRTSILGNFPERIPVFVAFTWELRAINEMCALIGWPPMFRSDFADDKRPRTFGFLIRPTLKEFNDFVHLLDKMMSENLNRDFFVQDVAPDHEEVRKNGKVVVRRKGTIELLQEWLSTRFRAPDPKPIQDMLATFREVRHLRQRPAHVADEDRFDQTYFQQQRVLMIRSYRAVKTLKLILANHPKAKAYRVNEFLQEENIWTY